MHHSKSLISVAAFLLALPAFAAPPANSPYNTDNVDKFVHEQSAAAFDTVENVLCYVGQMKGESFINQGSYKALVDENLCESGETQGQSSNGSNNTTSSSSPKYQPVTINVTQESATDPVIGSVWVHEAGDSGDITMPAKLTTTATPNDTNPWGLFRLDWGFTGMQGLIQTSNDTQNQTILQFAEIDGGGRNNLASLLKTGETSGRGSVSDGTHSFDIAFDENHFLRSKDNDQQCFDRKEYTSNVWRYGLYDATSGERITRNSGFPIKKGDDWGWAGYWGVWLPGDANVQTGETVQRASFDGTTGQSYTVFKAEGKLTKHSKVEATLGEIKGIPLEVHVFDGQNADMYQVEWNGSGFTKTHQLQCGGEGQNFRCDWKDASGILTFGQYDYDLAGYSQALGGNVRIPLRDNNGNLVTLSDASGIILHTEDTVLPGDTVPTALKCFENCISAADGSASPGQGYYQAQAPATVATAYTFGTDMLLRQGGAAVTPTSSWGNNQNLRTGPLVTDAQLSSLTCDLGNGSSTCAWKAWDLDTFYTWETGTESWNHLVLLTDQADNPVEFDPPLLVQYTHTNGSKFRLEYNGFGDLHGIPGKCVDPGTNEETECGPGTHYISKFNIADGATVTGSDSKSYLVKWLGVEQRMKKTDLANCSGLSLESLALPSISSWQDPNIGAEPTVNAPPKVIGGVIQQ